MIASLALLPLFLNSAFSAPSSFVDDQVCLDQKCYHLDTEQDRADLARYFSSNPESLPKNYSTLSGKDTQVLFGIENSLLKQMTTADGDSKQLERNTLLEIHRALKLGNEDPFPEGFELLAVPYHFLRDLFSSPYIRGKTAATQSKSLFHSWESRGDIHTLDLAVGLQTSHPANFNFNTDVCTYLKKKSGTGIRPGFKVTCNGTPVKLKFGEIHSHAFASRILWALGYAVAPADYVPHINVAYDRRIFSEINGRHGVDADIKLFSIKVGRINYKPKVDMMKYVQSATLKDGRVITASELATQMADVTTEAQIATVTTTGTQLQLEDSKVLPIGEWSFNDFDHPDDRGIRALAIALAWFDGWDFRQDNNSLAINFHGDTPQFEFYLPDVGSSLGSARSFYSFNNSIEDLKGLRHRITRGDHLARFTTIEKNEAFKKCSHEDAKWMLSLLNQLSSDQIKIALQSSGYNGQELEQFLEVLLDRRDQLNRAFE